MGARIKRWIPSQISGTTSTTTPTQVMKGKAKMKKIESQQLDIFSASLPSFKFTKPIKLIELFAGYGSQLLAFKYLGINAEHYKICEWAVPSIEAYNDIHVQDYTDYSKDLTKEQVVNALIDKGISFDYNEPATPEQIKRKPEEQLRRTYNNIVATNNLVDVSRVHGKDFYMENRKDNNVMMTYSFPCFTMDMLVLTKEFGYIPFIQVKPGYHVLSKDHKWHVVNKFFNQGVKQTFHISGQGFDDIHCTPDHKFWVRENKNEEPKWMHAKDIHKGCYFGVPVIEEEIPFETNNLDFWYVMGAYIGDGWINSSNGDIKISCNKTKLEKIKSKFESLGYCYTINKTSSNCWNIRTHNNTLKQFIFENFGSRAELKHIPFEVIALPKKQLKEFYDGYLNSDGCKIENKIQFTTININLAYSFSLIINKLFHRVCNIYKIKTTPTKIIEDRLVNQKDWYQLRFKEETSKRDFAFYKDGYIWYKFRSSHYGEEEPVYDIEVDEDHSFTLNGCLVSNCQDLSVAGKCLGMDADSGTRSSMIWQVGRILREMKDMGQLPDVLMMENVPQVISDQNKANFNKWLDILESLGYHSFYKILEATNFGIPQTRKRCFVISIPKDYSYEFPTGWNLNVKLKDFLETDVDEKYFLSKKLIGCFLYSSSEKFDRPKKFVSAFKHTNSGVANTIITEPWGKPESNYIADGCNINDFPTDRESILNGFNAYGCAMRGRDDKKQHIEMNGDEVSNTITTVQKDSLVAVSKNGLKLELKSANRHLSETIEQNDLPVGETKNMDMYNRNVTDNSSTLTLPNHCEHALWNGYRIRRLTPRECFRLMGVKDEDFEKVEDKLPQTWLYHLAGDSIVVNVMMEMFKQML